MSGDLYNIENSWYRAHLGEDVFYTLQTKGMITDQTYAYRVAQGIEQTGVGIGVFHVQPNNFGAMIPHKGCADEKAFAQRLAEILLGPADQEFFLDDETAHTVAAFGFLKSRPRVIAERLENRPFITEIVQALQGK